MQTTSWQAYLQRQTHLEQRIDALRDHYLFLQEMFRGWKDYYQLPVSSEERRAYFMYLQKESLHLRQALQQVQQDLQQERKKPREDVEPFAEPPL